MWNYEADEVQLCEISQKSLIKAFDEIANTEEYDDFDAIDFTIAKEGSGLETRYTLTPLPVKKDAKEKLEQAWNVAKNTISMEKYIAGEPPFKKD